MPKAKPRPGRPEDWTCPECGYLLQWCYDEGCDALRCYRCNPDPDVHPLLNVG